ncbi:Flp pilus assembly protein CpaB [Nostocoides sp. F2B08]|uniref:Flp pilus assembly protein CpaB n=1 Tax=Nostocoides sp. F2B08 TaxID=2653936 RepID=UPI0012638C9F|nr:RcpC/CpaB family pilus assembly protein [Tetrasphaera sp. F2B08]KAB7741870.1 Flp pilus assembly protein CpaB [Tetrasphaera sp. F2B08]
MGKRIIAILAAVLLALIGAVLVLLYAANADERAVQAQAPTTVYVSQDRVPAGLSLREAVRTGRIVETQVPSASKPEGALESIDGTTASLLALTDLPPGQVVLAAAFGETPEGIRKVNVPADMLAVSVELSDPARVGTFVTPGSRITIFATYELKSLETTDDADQFNELGFSETSVWLPDVEVLAMGEESLTPTLRPADGEGDEGNQPSNQAPSYLVTVAVTPRDAAKLVHGINQYVLYLGLRGEDAQVAEQYFGDVERDRIPQ